jgi:hypothetical protein
MSAPLTRIVAGVVPFVTLIDCDPTQAPFGNPSEEPVDDPFSQEP